MAAMDLEAYVARSRAIELARFPWADVPRHPVSPEAIRTLQYMQDIESHTIIYLRELLATRAVDEPDVATFLACWLYEETFHGLALARFLEAAGHPVGQRARPRGQEPFLKRLEATAVALLSRAWPDFCALHMTWGAINELTTLTAYRRLSKIAGHPVLSDLLERIGLDESRHFFFYYRQAEDRLQRPGAARVSRAIVDRFWAPVGSGEQAKEELRFLAGYLFGDEEGRAAARKIDETIRRLPGFSTVRLVEHWIDSFGRARPALGPAPAARMAIEGGRNGDGHH
jgi:hypothetical protein